MNRVKLLLRLANAFRRAWDNKIDRNGAEHDKGGLFTEKGNSGESTATESTVLEISIEELPRQNGRRRFELNGHRYTQIKLPSGTYARVMSEIDTNMTKERRKQRRFFQHIGNFIYDIIIVNDYVNDIVIVGQKRIK